MARIILGVTGSVAAVRTPPLYKSLASLGHQVRVVATDSSLNFFDPTELGPPLDDETGGPLFRDEDEWRGAPYKRGDPVLHIEFRKWADLLVIAPLDANTLFKIALGGSDNFLTCIYRAWDFARPVILAPAMNTLMWRSPVTLRHFRQILDDHAAIPTVEPFTLDQAPEIFAAHAPRLILIPPQAKQLACGDVGTGAMAEVSTIAEAVRTWVAGGEAASSDGAEFLI